MKKFATAIVVGIAMLSGIACGGGSSWSSTDKAEFSKGLASGEALGVITHDQSKCILDWAQDHYKSYAAMQADAANVDAGRALLKKCNIAPSVGGY